LILETQIRMMTNAEREKPADAEQMVAKGDYYGCGAMEKNPQAVAFGHGLWRKPA
jgi:hypothetical protein